MFRLATVAALAAVLALVEARDYRPIVGVLSVPLLVCIYLAFIINRLLLERVVVLDTCR